jgi:hypothetical protein
MVLALASRTDGGISAPNSSVIASRDGTTILLMLSPVAGDDHTSIATLPNGHVVDLHQVFPKSGLYKTSTLEPVWQVNWFALRRDLLYSDDLRYIVRLNRFGLRSNWAIAFYDDGELVRTYDCAFLLTRFDSDRTLPFTSSDWHTQWYEDFDLNADRSKVMLSTAQRRLYFMGHDIDLGREEFYTFDLARGNLVSKRIVGAWVVWAYGVSLMFLTGALVFAARSLLRKLTKRDRRRGFPIGVAGGEDAHN